MRNLFSSIAILIVLFFAACSSSGKPAPAAADTSSATPVSASVYTCPMHPEIQSNQPGTCSICKMDLVAATDSTAADTSAHDSHQH